MRNQRETNQYLLNHLKEIMECSDGEIKMKLQACCNTLEDGDQLSNSQRSFLKEIKAI